MEKNNILSLECDGQLIEGDDNLLNHASDYYADLFGPPIEYDVQLDPDLWEGVSTVSDTENTFLCRPFSEEEIKGDLDLMKKTKLQGQTRSQSNFIRGVGKSLRMT